MADAYRGDQDFHVVLLCFFLHVAGSRRARHRGEVKLQPILRVQLDDELVRAARSREDVVRRRQELDDRVQLNPTFIGEFITRHLHDDFIGGRSTQLTFTYTLKVSNELHKALKMTALQNDMTMSEYVRQMFQFYYYPEEY